MEGGNTRQVALLREAAQSVNVSIQLPANHYFTQSLARVELPNEVDAAAAGRYDSTTGGAIWCTIQGDNTLKARPQNFSESTPCGAQGRVCFAVTEGTGLGLILWLANMINVRQTTSSFRGLENNPFNSLVLTSVFSDFGSDDCSVRDAGGGCVRGSLLRQLCLLRTAQLPTATLPDPAHRRYAHRVPRAASAP